MQNSKNYDRIAAVIFMATWGIVFLDRLTASQASDVIIRALDLTTVQFSALTSLSNLSFAVSSVVIGFLSDRTGKRKAFLFPFVLICGLIALGCVFVRDYRALLVLRIASGFFEGPVLSLMMAILADISTKGRFGSNAGITAAGVSIFANTMGPPLVTRLATGFSWNIPYAVTGVLQIAAALVILFVIKELKSGAEQCSPVGLRDIARGLVSSRNVVLCIIIGIFSMTGYWSMQIFAPIYLTNVMKLPPVTRGTVSAVMGLIFIFSQLLVPALSDRIGRKKALILALIFGALAPLSMWIAAGSSLSVCFYCIFGGLIATTSALFGNVIPMESLPDNMRTSAAGVVMGISEIIGGMLWPLLAGRLYDRIGDIVPVMMITGIIFILAVLVSFGLKETNKK
ncbi:MAG: MFS transporter [Lachnospiraceae bacterium]|nr:MFS transporter [Lachnospiraceae bacterium]